MFSVKCYNALTLIEEILASLGIRKEEITELKRKSGIDPDKLSGLLNKIKKYHSGVYQHSINVAQLSAQLAQQLNLTAMEVYIITIGALFHDIGKISLPYAILNKKSELNKEEWMLVKKHPQIGVSLISRYDCTELLEPLILLHHERFDGKGYYNVVHEKIPLSVRIISLADAFDAMVSPRSYQKERDKQSCWKEIEECSGTQFDPDLLPGFHSVIFSKIK